jgi:hypothetical protein
VAVKQNSGARGGGGGSANNNGIGGAARRRNAAQELQISIDDQLSRLEEDIRRLKIEFDIYFNGAAKRPPYDTKSRVETIIKRIGDERSLTFAQRYRYNSLVARYTSFRELWRRNVQSREEGRDAAAAAARNAKSGSAQDANLNRTTFACADARTDVQTVKNLYDAVIEAKRKCGETTDDFSFPQFHRLVAAKTDSLKSSLNCERVRFSVSVENGRVSFRAKAEE